MLSASAHQRRPFLGMMSRTNAVQENPGLMAFMHIDLDYYKKPRAKAGAQQRVDKFLHAKNLEENEAEKKERLEK